MTFAGLDYVSGGRDPLRPRRLGPAGDRGVPRRALREADARIKEVVEVCRKVWKREVIELPRPGGGHPAPGRRGHRAGQAAQAHQPSPVRSSIPVWWASLTGKSVEATAEVADG